MPFGGFPWGRLAFAETGLAVHAVRRAGRRAAGDLRHRPVRCRWPRRPCWHSASWAPGRRRWSLLARRGARRRSPCCPSARAEGRPVTVAARAGQRARPGMDAFGERERCCATTSTPPTGSPPTSGPAGSTEPDLVMWPENSSDIDPFQRPRGAAPLIDDAVQRRRRADAGRARSLDGPGPDHVSNNGIVWDPATGPGRPLRQAAPGAVRRVHPVPRRARPALITRLDQIPRDFYAGHRPGILTVGPARVGDVICFEVAYDGLVRDVVRGGAAGARRADQQRDVQRHRADRRSSSR